jgi:RNA polymerase sigma factor (sigma-70 family)
VTDVVADYLLLFESWYQQDMTSLYKFVWYQVQDKAAAEDITAVTCERAFMRLDRYDPARGSMRAWVFGIARNEIAEYRRVSRRGFELVDLDEELPGTDARPELLLQHREMITHLLQSLERLPTRDQEVIALRFGAGFSYAEIAGMVGASENHVAVIVHRTIKKLKLALESEGEH